MDKPKQLSLPEAFIGQHCRIKKPGLKIPNPIVLITGIRKETSGKHRSIIEGVLIDEESGGDCVSVSIPHTSDTLIEIDTDND